MLINNTAHIIELSCFGFILIQSRQNKMLPTTIHATLNNEDNINSVTANM